MNLQPTPETFPEVIQQWNDVFAETKELAWEPAWWLEIGIAIGCALFARGIAALLLRWKGYNSLTQAISGRVTLPQEGHHRILFPLLCSLLLWIAFHLGEHFLDRHCLTLRALALACLLFVAFMLIFQFFRGKIGAQLLFTGIFIWAILYITKLSGPVSAGLEAISYTKGTVHLSARKVILGLAVIYLLCWIAGVIVRFFDSRITRSQHMSRSTQVLMQKILHIGIYGVAIMAGLKLVGVNFANLAFFGGALGIGIGFGLQKIIANFISGIIIVAEKSIKPGDLIEIGESYGEVVSLRTRYASVMTRDYKEHLIPNEQLITETVVSYSHSTENIGVKVPIGIAYGSDVLAVIDLCIETMKGIPRISGDPAPNCFLANFGDSSVDLLLTFSVPDPRHGTIGAKSEVLKAIWLAFKENDVQIPFPQQELRVLSDDD